MLQISFILIPFVILFIKSTLYLGILIIISLKIFFNLHIKQKGKRVYFKNKELLVEANLIHSHYHLHF